MSAISNSLLDAINTISTNAVKASNATLTIECTITEVEDAGLQIYKVNYKDNIFSATSSSGSYNVGDIVYVLVPEGDFSKPKMILGAVVPSSANLVEEEVTDNYIEISENLFGNISDVELCSYKLTPHDTPVTDISNFKNNILNYLNDGHRDFVFSMQIKTNLDLEQQRIGNYGIQLHLPVVVDDGHGGQEHTEQILNMDISSILGNPYRLNNFTYQEIRYTFPDNVKQDNSEDAKELLLEKFAINFPLQDDNKDPDIFIKDISFKAVDILTAEHKEGYYLSLVCKDGNYFVENSGDKIIEPVLKLNGKSSKINTDEQDCYWFIEDSSVNSSSPEYTYIAKSGQRCLNDLNLETSQYVTNVLSYTVKRESVIAEVKYRCSLVNVSKQIQKDAYITLSNKNKVIECFLTTVDNINTYPKDMGNVSLIATVEGIKSSDRIDLAQRRLDIDTEKELDSSVITIQGTSYIPIPDTDIGNQEGKASMPVSAISSQANKIICTFYISNEDKYGVVTQKILGTKEIIVQTTAEMVQHIAVQNGDVLYKYDGNGNSPMVADYAYPYQAKKTIPDITFKVYKNDGTELNEDEYNYCDIKQLIPKNSMIKKGERGQESEGDYYKYGGKGIEFQSLGYDIEDIWNPKKTDNYIILTVNFKDINLTEEINIKFVKEGESGTNGSAYTGMITFNNGLNPTQHDKQPTYDEIDNLKICRLQLIHITNGEKAGWYYNKNGYVGGELVSAENYKFQFGIKLYCNGEVRDLTDSDEVNQNTFDEFTTHPKLKHDSGDKFIIDENASEDKFCTIIYAEIKVGNVGALYEDGTDQEIIYAYYPVEVITITSSDTYDITKGVPYIADGYSQVLYASDGTNPQFDSTNPFRLDNSTSIINEYTDSYIYEQYSSSNIQRMQESESPQKCKGIPITRYNSGDSLNYIQVTLKAKGNEYQEKIEEDLNELNTQLDEYNNYINNLNKLLSTNTESGLLKQLYDKIDSFKIDINDKLSQVDILTFLNKRQSILSKIEEFKKFMDNNKKKMSKYNESVTSLRVLRTDLQNVANHLSDISNYINNIPALGNTVDGAGLSSKTKKQFNEYKKQINEALNKFKNCINDTDTLAAYVDLINYLRIFINQCPNFSKEDYDPFNIYFDLLSFKDTYNGMINRLAGPQLTTTDQISDYAFVSTKSDINNLINQIINIMDKILKQKYDEQTIELILQYTERKKDILIEIKGLNEILKYFIQGYLVISRPIIMLYNRYGMSNIIGQDGNKLYIDESDNPQYLLAPQVGAGKKDKNNLFTGMVMGIRGFGKDTENKSKQTGLFGYHENIQTMFLNAEDGSAIFGKSGTGQIIIDPSTDNGLIYSSTYQKKYKIDGKPDGYSTNNISGEGMLIDFTNSYIHLQNETYEKDKNGNFVLDENNQQIKIKDPGRIYSGNHNSLKNKNDGFYLSKEGLSIGSKVKITEEGIAYFGTNAVNNGTKCQKINGGNPDSNPPANSSITYNATELGFDFDNNKITGNDNSVYIGTDGIRLGTQFAVDNTGNMSAKNIKIKDVAEIGNQKIEKGNIVGNPEDSNQIILDANGAIKSVYGEGNDDYNQIIDRSGDAYFKNIHCNNVFTIGQEGTNNYQSSSDNGQGGFTNTFSFGMGNYGSIASGGFSLSGNGTVYGANGLKMDPTTTKVGDNDLPTYVGNIAANRIDANVINTKIANADLATTGTIKCGSLNITGGSSTINGRLNMTGENGVIAFSDQKMDGSSVVITQGSNSYRVFLAKPVNS